ncbi:MAG TPA: lipid-binding SYLF domain-containing protein [Terriglobales bacterium]|nr:lipid-binding SYLF domain-containing protein [Terriglobales bacterium]
MLRKSPSVLVLLAVAATVAALPSAARAQKAIERLQASAKAFHEIMGAPDGGIPDLILKHTQCVMVVPGYKKAGLGFGGELGRGVVTCRTGNGWSAPLFVSLGGASFGLQIGAQESDVVMLIMNREGEDSLLKDKVSLGGDMAATAGPVGRDANAQTDLMMQAKMLAYSRSKGLFGGITIKGGVIKQDHDSNKWLYKDATAQQILDGKVPLPDAAKPLLAELGHRAG